MLETDVKLKVAFSTSGIASIVHYPFLRVLNVRFVLLSLFQSSIIPFFHGITAFRVRGSVRSARPLLDFILADGGHMTYDILESNRSSIPRRSDLCIWNFTV